MHDHTRPISQHAHVQLSPKRKRSLTLSRLRRSLGRCATDEITSSTRGTLHLCKLEPGRQDDVLQCGRKGRIPSLAPTLSPRGVPEQMTFGPTQEEGIAVSPDARMLVTSAGIRESTVWVHDSRGDRQISGEGFAIVPGLGFAGGGDVRSVFSPDGRGCFICAKEGRAYKSGELWAAALDSGGSGQFFQAF